MFLSRWAVFAIWSRAELPPLSRAAPDFADVPLVTPNADSLLHVASNLVAPPDRTTVRAEIRAPPLTPKPPPPAHAPSENENAQTTDVPSDYQSDRRGDWDYPNWKWQGHRYRLS